MRRVLAPVGGPGNLRNLRLPPAPGGRNGHAAFFFPVT